MADIEKIIGIIQSKVLLFDQDYKLKITDTLEIVWAEMVDRHEWWFMRASAPYKLTTVVGQKVYIITKDDVGRILQITDINGKKRIFYRDREGFASGILSETDSDANIGSPISFAEYGIVGGKKQIIISPTPGEVEDYYLHYNLKGLIANFDRLPDSGSKTLIHGIMSILAPPEEKVRYNPGNTSEQVSAIQYLSWWKAITQNEDEMYEEGLKRMINESGRIAAPEIPINRIEPITGARLDEVNEI